ncbi:MAG: GspE/PulE family protein [Verrucomicrobiales bacterium]|jgi:type IV pilus assembly protein PilB|nr:GspE/PulE family protein [Verrucomicrobiales bacterium]MDA7644278.1 GspE/PulE family protein [Verrucomicrobiales bacterium]NCF84725.1 pilus assembly protein PilB [Verrucomicrobiaceae bacterium]
MNTQNVLDLLQTQGYIDANQSEDMMSSIVSSGKDVLDAVQDYGVMDRNQFYQVVAAEIGAEFMDLTDWEPGEALTKILTSDNAHLYGALPVAIGENGLQVAFVDPLNAQNMDDLRFAVQQEIVPVVGDVYRVQYLIDKVYGEEDMNDVLMSFGEGDEAGDSAEDLEKEANAAPIIRYVDLVLLQAIKERASDIHFEPFEDDFKIRYRVDGSLYEMAPPPGHLATPIISRVKVMSNLNIAERRLPQDGRIQKMIGSTPCDLRVSTLPTVYGESVVLRVLDRSSVNLDLENLGLPEDIYNFIDETIFKPNGIFIVTGPTGAGKTTTLYACLRKINTIDSKLLTAEDPVEYDMDGIVQVPSNESVGVTFAKILRAFLRQDPDRIMVGEMRDPETVQIAVQASLTGHLVLSTLHTNDATGAVTRLLDMGTEPFLLSASLLAVLAQRLLRTICADCREAYEPNEAIISQLGLSPHELGDKSFYTGAGCDRCGHSGYRGRKGLYELFEVNDTLRDMITEREPTVVLRQRAVEMGMRVLREDGLRNIYEGLTTIEEVLKYT